MAENFFGEYLKRCRKELDISLSDLHRLTGVSQPYLSQIESGKIPSRKTILKLANGMGKDVLEIATYETNMLSLAGYKTSPEPGEESFDEYMNTLNETPFIESSDSEVQRLELEIEKLQSIINLNKIIDDKAKIFLDDEELSPDEKTMLIFNLLSIRAVRESKK